jgi:hypothetical protein
LLDLVAAIGAVDHAGSTIAALHEAMGRGRLVPFLGPDFPTALTGLPDRQSLVRRLAPPNVPVVQNSLAKAAEAARFGNSRHRFTEILLKAVGDPLAQPGPIHLALARLPVRLWLSGAYDILMPKALHAQTIISGADTIYVRENWPTVVCLSGAPSDIRSLIVLESDYVRLRETEEDRRLLVKYLRHSLEGMVVLFLGHDPNSPDFALLTQHILNQHLAGVAVRPFLVWPEVGQHYSWAEYPILHIQQEPLAFIRQLVTFK